jgi:hypothetical protein
MPVKVLQNPKRQSTPATAAIGDVRVLQNFQNLIR